MSACKIRNNVIIPIIGAKVATQFVTFDGIALEHIAILFGEIDTSKPVLVRIHSECLTGDVFGSFRCDCGNQLKEAIQKIDQHGSGVIIYLRQEGRGIGLYSKIDAYALQSQGVDTFTANQILGYPDDLRTYDDAVAILNALAIKEIDIITNNPDKISCMADGGIVIHDVISTGVYLNQFNKNYLLSKAKNKNHTIKIP